MTSIRSRLVIASILLLATTPHAQRADAGKWDVTADNGPATTVTFDTSEGTWMNLDVSPTAAASCSTCSPISTRCRSRSAAPASRRASSPPPPTRCSRASVPTASSMAFISDRGGLFNVWLANANGSSPRQISNEQRWWITRPTWSPDGQYVCVRRHFVGERSLGAGEVWMFHVSGADGVQVTGRASIQKAAGAAFGSTACS